ncbi:MAG: hypothetical protein V7629_04905 [Motiliproteus sp.]
MPTSTQNCSHNSPAPVRAYLNLVATATGARLNENPLTAALELGRQPDDSRLLIALGEVCGSNRPISPIGMTQLAEVLILWLNQHEWLVLPQARYGHNLGLALEQSFGAALWLEPIPDGTFQAELSPQAVLQLQRAHSDPLNECDLRPLAPTTTRSICIRPWTPTSHYDLLLTRADQNRLQAWLAAPQR